MPEVVMDNQETSPKDAQTTLTQHAMLVVWGLYAQQIGLIDRLMQIKLRQKNRDHQPQTKLLEFFVAMLAGLPYLKDISRSAHPLDQDSAVAQAWKQPAWADYSGVSRTMQQMSTAEADAVIAALEAVEQPFIEKELTLACQRSGHLVYDLDLTGRPVSSTSTSYPDTAFGYMGDTISLGYQAALVSMHSPSYGRLWLANQLHPGDTVSVTEAQALVQAAERRTALRPRRRIEQVALRLQAAEVQCERALEQAAESEDRLIAAKAQLQQTSTDLQSWRHEAYGFEAEYRREQRQPTDHCKLARARRKVLTYQSRLPRCQAALATAERRYQRHQARLTEIESNLEQLRSHYRQLESDNATNHRPVRVILRIDAGFASRENIEWLIEMGYDIYTKSRSSTVREALQASLSPETTRQRVGGNASLTAWPDTTVNDYFTYPLNVALAHYQLGEASRHSVLLHYGDDAVTSDLAAWFHTYNGRQTIEAGIKEGKSVFQMHHLKVRTSQALRLQEHFACFAANFVRFAALWLSSQQPQAASVNTKSVKHMVQVCAHTSAWVMRHGDVWLLRFTDQSLYAGHSLRIGNGPFQLPLPLERNFHFQHF
jgi:hypothetical protein